MRLISIEDYDPVTMQLAKPIFDRQRRILLAAGRSIHPTYLNRLEEMDIRYLFVEDAISHGITMDEVLDMTVWVKAIGMVQTIFEKMTKGKELPVKEIQTLITQIVGETSRRKALILLPSSSISVDSREYAHALNVTILALQLGKAYKLAQMPLRDLAIGALLHDIGKYIDGPEDHTIKGFEYLRKNREISLLSSHVAYQHHEHFDGKGTPRGVAGKEILLNAQIVGIANMYDQFLSMPNVPPHEAMERVMMLSGNQFSPELVQTFIQEVPTYIPGTKVLVNNGREAIVTKILKNIQRPFIRFIDTKQELSLAEHHTILISEVLPA